MIYLLYLNNKETFRQYFLVILEQLLENIEEMFH